MHDNVAKGKIEAFTDGSSQHIADSMYTKTNYPFLNKTKDKNYDINNP